MGTGVLTSIMEQFRTSPNGGADGARPKAGAFSSGSNSPQNMVGYPDGPPSTRPVYLLPHHEQTLTAIAPDVISERGYRSEVTPSVLASHGFTTSDTNGKPPKWVKECVPALLIPVWNAAGEEALVQIRPDKPRFKDNGKPNKYETPRGFKMAVDVHPRIQKQISDPAVELWITEGVKKADAAISRGLCCVALLGVWNWRGTNDAGAATVLPDWEHFAFKAKDGTPRLVNITFDSDVARKAEVAAALKRFVAWLEFRGAKVTVVYLSDGPNGEKTGLDDFFERGGTVDDLRALAQDGAAAPAVSTVETQAKALSPSEIRAAFKEAAAKVASPCSLDDVKATFRRWIHVEDAGAIEVTLGTVAANLMDGDAVWLMLVGGSSGGKTEIVNPLLGLPFVREAAVLTESSLLSGSSKRDRAAGAKGGLLREIGPFGFLVLKDFTSILSMNKDAKTATLGALREVYDGSWTRHVGSDGGQQLQWKGKLAAVACCTEAIDEHHAVIGSMGERFAFFRLPQLTRKTMARRAIDLTGAEAKMREEMAGAVAGLFAGADIPARPHELSEAETDRLISLADFASKCRSAVMRDFKSEIVLVPESEYPARIAKIFRRIFSGMLAIGVDRARAWELLAKIAFDSMHKIRRQVIELFIERDGAALTTSAIALTLDLPTTTTRRALEDLNAHGALMRVKIENPKSGSQTVDTWKLSEWSLEILPEIGRGRLTGNSAKHGVAKSESDSINHPNTPSDRITGESLFAEPGTSGGAKRNAPALDGQRPDREGASAFDGAEEMREGAI